MNEFVMVCFDGEATVFVDGTMSGITNKKMIVETGEHIFDLGDRADYAPRSITKQIVGSTIDDPFPIIFGKV